MTKGQIAVFNGLNFENVTNLREAIIRVDSFRVEGDFVYNKDTSKLLGILVEKRKLLKFLKSIKNDWESPLSKQREPDSAIILFYNGDINKPFKLMIFEKKYQKGAGSVDEKLETIDYKMKQYRRLVRNFDLEVTYCYVLNDWFKQDCYKDSLDNIIEVGGRYFFNEVDVKYIFPQL